MTVETRRLPNHLLSRGQYSFTIAEAERLLGLDRAGVTTALSRLKQKGELFSPTRGLYVLIPPEYQSWGAPPADWFIDPLLRHLGQPYYVALLSAASIHGASHQAPQVFQVMARAQVRPRDFGRARIRFYQTRFFASAQCTTVTVPTGEMTASTKETTIVDLVDSPRAGGGLNNVATVILEIGELHGSSVAQVSSARGRTLVRRLGWLLEEYGQVDDLEALRQAARLDLGEPALLDPHGGRRGRTDKRWSLRINREIEPDV